MKYILSTMTSAVSYCFYIEAKDEGSLPTVRKRVTIHGGKGLPSLTSGLGEVSKDDTGSPLWTPNGVITPVSDEAYEELKNHEVFIRHLDKKYIKVVNEDISRNNRAIDKEVSSMAEYDKSALLTPATAKERLAGVMPRASTGDADDSEDFGKPVRIKG